MRARPLLIDASALTAFIRRERGGERVLRSLTTARREHLVSTIGLIEVEGKLVSGGTFTPEQVRTRIHQLGQLLTVVPFEVSAQRAASFYYARRKPYDLSLGDALCLGTAETLGADVMTAEQNWATLPDLPFAVELIRGEA
ncbi:PIN domain-containing protein [Deinococcus planocerae]|uniref:PIN domain-containing protein n=1 Tax=Deinococcus planocerae TaxID=1737569 RepID=UPI000C7F030A|nr:PIN domain-containing protein [Deinococcus planocerae]